MTLEAREYTIEVPRTARYLTLGGDDGPSEVWFVLHGYRQLASRFLRRFRGIADGRRLIVAPEALSRFYVGSEPGRHGPESRVGATWMTREARQDEIRDYVRYLDLLGERVLGDTQPPARVVLGFSQGVHTAARWVVRGTLRPTHLVLWGDDLPPDLDWDRAERMRRVRLSLVSGASDPSRRPEVSARQSERLARHGVEHERLEHPGGHEIDGALLGRIADRVRAFAQNSPTKSISGSSS